MWGKMFIKSLSGNVLFESDHKTVRGALEYCAGRGVDLTGADLRRAKLSHVNLDGLKATKAQFWGADFTGTDLGYADLRRADLRNANFTGTCLAETDISRADLRGAYFNRTILENTRLDHILVSCPSFWDCDLQSAASFKGLIFSHKGEYDALLDTVPFVIRGLKQRLVMAGEFCFWGNRLYPSGLLPHEGKKQLFLLKTTIDRMLKGYVSPNATKPIPKIRGADAAV